MNKCYVYGPDVGHYQLCVVPDTNMYIFSVLLYVI